MNWLDAVIIVFLAISTVAGLSNGLMKSIIPLIGIIVGIVLAGRFYGTMADWLSGWLENPGQANIAGFAIIFVLVILAAFILASLLSKFLSALKLGWVDKLGGAILGLITAALIWGAILTVIARFHTPYVETTLKDSALSTFLLNKFPMVLPFLPNEFDVVRDFFG